MTEHIEAGHWMLLEPGAAARFESIGVCIPERVLTSEELMASTKHRTRIDLERLTGIRQRHVVGEGEDSFSLAVSAARDCFRHSRHQPSDIEMLISCSIAKYRDGLTQQLEPPLSMDIKNAIGAPGATSFDIANACAGMLTGVFILNDFIRRGAIDCGMVVSGEDISHLGTNAAKQVRSIMSKQLASLTLGDAGAAAIVERAPAGAPGITVAAFTTLAEYSRLCLAYPSRIGPGAQMYTDARGIHKAAIGDLPPLLGETLVAAGVDIDDIDYVIPHQTSARAIRGGIKAVAQAFGGRAPRHTVVNVEDFGNTASTTHFLALHRYLTEQRFQEGDKIALIALASGLEIGVVLFEMDELRTRYGDTDRSGHSDTATA